MSALRQLAFYVASCFATVRTNREEEFLLFSIRVCLSGVFGLLFRYDLISIPIFSMLACSLFTSGCATTEKRSTLPGRERLVRDQLVIYSDFHLPKNHRLIGELTSRRQEISELLGIPTTDEPINVFLFEDQDHFRNFMTQSHPEFPNRRAFFVKNDTSLNVYAFWGSRVGEDLRHEITHGYVHGAVPNIPLWLDEGIAEYFEIGRGKGGLNRPHVYHLANSFRRGEWTPDLTRLESLVSASELTQMDYAESWLWVHFLLSGDSQSRSIIQGHLKALVDTGSADPIMRFVQTEFPDYETRLIMHLKMLDGNP